MDLIIGRDDKKKKEKNVKVTSKPIVDTKAINKAILDLNNLLNTAYENKPSVELYDAKIHLGQLYRSIIAAKLPS